MAWFSILALALCAFLVTSAAGVHGRFKGKIAFVIAASALIGAAMTLLRFGPGEGLARLLTVGVPGLACLSCYWAVHRHLESSRYAAGLNASILGFALFCLAFLAQFGERGLVASWQELETADSPAAESRRISDQLARLDSREVELQERQEVGIPAFRQRLRQDAQEVQAALASASPAVAGSLGDELEEIARLLVALKQEESAVADLLVRLRQEQRRLGRLRSTRETLGDNDELLAELDRIWIEAGTRLNRPLDERLGRGVIEERQVQDWVARLRNE